MVHQNGPLQMNGEVPFNRDRCSSIRWVLGVVWFCLALSGLDFACTAWGQESPSLAIPTGKLGEVVRLGEAIVEKTDTHPLSKAFVGNGLRCRSCHLDNGKHLKAATFIGTATSYPAWSPRENRVITLEDRVLNCFMRSCNGTRPPLGSEVSVAITTYITWLSQGQGMQMNPLRPVGPHAVSLLPKIERLDAGLGRALYERRCAECHQSHGEGNEESPPVWGDRSYNDGAGFANDSHLAAWIKVAMPLGDETLTAEESQHLAAYINQHYRPAFRLEDHLPPAERLGEYNGQSAAGRAAAK